MATDLAEKAKEAFVDDDFDLAVDLYTQAINLDPKSADLFADRAQANMKLNNFTEAVADANKAIELDPLMAKAYFRKGTACFKLEEYHTAKAALEKGASLAQNDSRFTKLITECDDRILLHLLLWGLNHQIKRLEIWRKLSKDTVHVRMGGGIHTIRSLKKWW
ncbi:hypothetical protein CsSME_00045061 [Camellia sinensis var. sinensis]